MEATEKKDKGAGGELGCERGRSGSDRPLVRKASGA